ncbi:MAG: helix-turn-helix domain-containing protein [Anaerovoracaceae bacterium]
MVRKRRKLTPFGKAVKKAAIEKDIKLAEVAEEIGISRQFLTNILVGERPGYQHCEKIIKILELSENWKKDEYKKAKR